MKIKTVLRIIRETVLISLVCILAAGLIYENVNGTFERNFGALKWYISYQTGYIESDREMLNGSVLWDSAGQESNEEKQIKTSITDWVALNCKQAINMSTTIFRGKVLSRSTETKGLPIYKSDGSLYGYDYYREVTVEVVDMIKGDKSQKTILYKEPGGETENFIYAFDGIDPLNIGQEYIFLLYENNTFLNPASVMPIKDGQVWVSDQMCPEELQAEGERVYAQILPVDTYMKAIKETYWYVTALRVLVSVAVIGAVGAIIYFVCRNLFKTTRFIVYKVKKKVSGSGL